MDQQPHCACEWNQNRNKNKTVTIKLITQFIVRFNDWPGVLLFDLDHKQCSGIIKGWLQYLTSESKRSFLVNNTLMFGSVWCLVIAQIKFSLIKRNIDHTTRTVANPNPHPPTSNNISVPLLFLCVFFFFFSYHLSLYMFSPDKWRKISMKSHKLVLATMFEFKTSCAQIC